MPFIRASVLLLQTHFNTVMLPPHASHLQDLPFFDRLSPGELMARTSGDSLTVRSIVSSTSYNVRVWEGGGGQQDQDERYKTRAHKRH